MKSTTDRRRETAAARHACFVIERNFGSAAFLVAPDFRKAVEAAESRGWAQWVGPGRCVLTPEGLREAVTYTGVTT